MSELNQERLTEDLLYTEQEKLKIYDRDVTSTILTRGESLNIQREIRDATTRSILLYEKMLYVIFVQTILMITQTLLFAGIYFKL
jgi:hypothetical protein